MYVISHATGTNYPFKARLSLNIRKHFNTFRRKSQHGYNVDSAALRNSFKNPKSTLHVSGNVVEHHVVDRHVSGHHLFVHFHDCNGEIHE